MCVYAYFKGEEFLKIPYVALTFTLAVMHIHSLHALPFL